MPLRAWWLFWGSSCVCWWIFNFRTLIQPWLLLFRNNNNSNSNMLVSRRPKRHNVRGDGHISSSWLYMCWFLTLATALRAYHSPVAALKVQDMKKCIVMWQVIYTPWVKKRCHPTLCQFLIDLQNSFTAAKSSKFPTKPILGYPPHLKYVAVLPWKT